MVFTVFTVKPAFYFGSESIHLPNTGERAMHLQGRPAAAKNSYTYILNTTLCSEVKHPHVLFASQAGLWIQGTWNVFTDKRRAPAVPGPHYVPHPRVALHLLRRTYPFHATGFENSLGLSIRIWCQSSYSNASLTPREPHYTP